MDSRNGIDRQRAELAALLCPSPPSNIFAPIRPLTNGAHPPPPLASPAPAVGDFERIAALGYGERSVPIIPPDAALSPRSSLALRVGKPGAKDPRGKAPGIRTDAGWVGYYEWTSRPTTSADRVDWQRAGAGVGLRMGDGLYAIDVDTVDAALAQRAREIIVAVIPGAHVERIGRAPKFLILLRVAEGAPVPYKLIEFGRGPDGKPERIEGLASGKQAVVAGIHPGTRQPYRWIPAMPAVADLVEATRQQVDALFEALQRAMPAATEVRTEGEGADRSIASLRGDPDQVEAIVRRLPNTTEHFPTRESYRDVGYAIKGAIADDERAFACFVEWSDRWEDPEGRTNPFGYAEAIWRTLHPRRIGASWLREKLEAVTGTPQAELWFAALPASTPSLWDISPSPSIIAEPAPSLPVRRIAGDETQRKIPVREWLIHPWCPAGNVSIVIGAPAVSKSTFLLMVALAVASGEENVLRGADRLSDERLHKHGKVVVYNAEDTLDEMERRLTGLRKFHGIDRFRHDIIAVSGVDDGARASDDDKLIIAERKENNGPILRGAGLQRLEALIREEQPALVILDPLISLSRGLVENSNEDMDRLLAILRAVARAGNTTILVAHHTAKSADKSGGDLNATRGASAIGAAVRGGISLTKHLVTTDTKQDGELRGLAPGWYVLAKDIKAQYGAENEPVAYRLKSTPVGNGTGDPLPESAQLLFDDDPAEFLRQSGDYVAVHEIVDRRGSDAVARAAASRRNVSEARRIAEIVLDQLGDRATAPFNTEYLAVAEHLQRDRIMRGDSRQRVADKLSSVLGRGVIVARAGKSMRVSMAKENESRTAPWVLQAEVVELKEDESGLSSLSD